MAVRNDRDSPDATAPVSDTGRYRHPHLFRKIGVVLCGAEQRQGGLAPAPAVADMLLGEGADREAPTVLARSVWGDSHGVGAAGHKSGCPAGQAVRSDTRRTGAGSAGDRGDAQVTPPCSSRTEGIDGAHGPNCCSRAALAVGQADAHPQGRGLGLANPEHGACPGDQASVRTRRHRGPVPGHQGTPRKVNRLAHSALTSAAITKAKVVAIDHVQAAREEIAP